MTARADSNNIRITILIINLSLAARLIEHLIVITVRTINSVI
jgi:hypothetical protein